MSALRNSAFESLYQDKFPFFNPIQTQGQCPGGLIRPTRGRGPSAVGKGREVLRSPWTWQPLGADQWSTTGISCLTRLWLQLDLLCSFACLTKEVSASSVLRLGGLAVPDAQVVGGVGSVDRGLHALLSDHCVPRARLGFECCRPRISRCFLFCSPRLRYEGFTM